MAKSKDTEAQLFALYDRLDRIEELLEDMSDLEITSRSEAEAKLLELNDQIDQLESASD
jgi:hypothetical protein